MNYRCLMCQSTEFDVDSVMMQGKWSRLINYSNKKYNAVSCKNCGHTMFFKEDARFSILEALIG
jgi:predicted nucleic-acid-binding Zn-ribbon protein